MHDHRFFLRHHRRPRLTGLAGLVVVVASACGGADRATLAPLSTKVPSPATTAPVTTLASDPVAAYRAYWDAYLAAADPMNPSDRRLDGHATGPALEVLRRFFGELATRTR